VALTFCSRVAFAHECADPGRSNNPGQQDNQENHRSCGSSDHFGKLYRRLYEMRKLIAWWPLPRHRRSPSSGCLPFRAWRVLKFFKVGEHGKLDFVVESFNLLNHTNVVALSQFYGADKSPPFQCSLPLIKQAFQGSCSSRLTLSFDDPCYSAASLVTPTAWATDASRPVAGAASLEVSITIATRTPYNVDASSGG
jgi:hypothetical protein